MIYSHNCISVAGKACEVFQNALSVIKKNFASFTFIFYRFINIFRQIYCFLPQGQIPVNKGFL